MKLIIDISDGLKSSLNNEDQWSALVLAELRDVINRGIPFEDNKWISVNDRLPEESDNYLVSIIDAENDDNFVMTDVAWFAHPNDYALKEGEWRELDFEEYKVIAWQPLPKPYKESEGEE